MGSATLAGARKPDPYVWEPMGHVERLTGMKHRVLASVVLLALIAGACGNDEVTVPADSLPSVDPEQPSVTDDVATTTPPVDDTIQGS